MSTKCYGCGLVNKVGAEECGRCGGVLGIRPQETLNPFEGKEPKTFSLFRVGLMGLFAVVASVIAFQALKPNVPVVKVPTPEEVKKQTELFQMSQKHAAVEKQFVTPVYQQPGLSRTKYDTPITGKPWNPTGNGSGGYTPPPPGTSYLMDKYGGMHQR